MNWGGFAGGFAQGFNNGVAMGKTINDVMKQKKIEDMRAQGIAEAQAARNAAVDSQIQSSDQGQQTSQNPAATLGITGQPSAPQQSAAAPANEQRTPTPETPAPAKQDKPMSPIDEDRSITQRQLLDEAPKSITPTAKTNDSSKGVLYVAGKSGFGSTNGLVEMGNIDLNNRPVVKNPDGSVSTVRSMSINVDGKEVLIPTVVGGKVVSNKEAIDHFMKTGEHLGKFDSVDAAKAYADVLHKQQEQAYASPSDQTSTTSTSSSASPEQTKPSIPAANGLPYVVNGKSYATREEARAAADKATPDVMTFMSKNLVPKMQQAYLEQGDLEKADAWGKWAEERDNKAAMKEWAGAYRAAQIGNFEKAADHVFELYKRYDDGITPMSKETVKDKDGNITGFNVRLKNDSTGEEYSQFIDKKALTEMGLAALSPQAMFEQQFRRQAEADKMAAQYAAENAKEDRSFRREIYKEGIKFGQQKELKRLDNDFQTQRDQRQQENALEKLTIEKQLDAANASSKVRREVGAKVEALRGAGYSDEFINNALPAILGVGDYKKATSPEEARRLAFSDRMKNDLMFGRKPPEEQRKIIDQDMSLVYGSARPTTTPRAASPSTPPSGRGTPVYNPATGKIEYR